MKKTLANVLDEIAQKYSLMTFDDWLSENNIFSSENWEYFYQQKYPDYEKDASWWKIRLEYENLKKHDDYYQLTPQYELEPLSKEEVRKMYDDETKVFENEVQDEDDFDFYRNENEIYSDDELQEQFQSLELLTIKDIHDLEIVNELINGLKEDTFYQLSADGNKLIERNEDEIFNQYVDEVIKLDKRAYAKYEKLEAKVERTR
ncbi:hypothetical protein [Mycoplasma buteonis]|uniref:hypothetical protein n=1 Tax=Mycoplasma buteonis TaxID=171280 RepID=UPI00055BE256|nr:hypothetical protein [Mycoplasma buteonis]